MHSKHFVAILVLLALLLPTSPANAGGVVTVCDEAHLLPAHVRLATQELCHRCFKPDGEYGTQSSAPDLRSHLR